MLILQNENNTVTWIMLRSKTLVLSNSRLQILAKSLYLNYEHFICKTYVSKIFIDVNEKSTIKIVVTTALEILVV